jgi:hypothetical protein
MLNIHGYLQQLYLQVGDGIERSHYFFDDYWELSPKLSLHRLKAPVRFRSSSYLLTRLEASAVE